MADRFVYSGAAGANDGTSWTDAWTSLASSNGVAAGDNVKVHKTHSQTGLGANINWSNGTVTNPVRIICVDKDASDALSTGASVEWTTGNLGPQGNIYSYGMTWRQTNGQLNFTAGTDGAQTHEQCTLVVTGITGVSFGGTRTSYFWRNVNVDLSGSALGTSIVTGGLLISWIGGTYTLRSTQTNLFTTSAPQYVQGVTFNGTVTNVISTTAANYVNSTTNFERCVGPTYTNLISVSPNPGGSANGDGLHPSGTITAAPLPPIHTQSRQGSVKAITSRYRANGANDGTQATTYSWDMSSNGNANDLVCALVSPPISRWVGTGSQTVTIYVGSGVTLQNDEFWIDVVSPSEAGSPTALPVIRTTRAAPLATPADLTADAVSTWTGSGVSVFQKCSVTIAPTIAGMVTVRVHLAKSTTTVYVDPVIDLAGNVSGNSRFIEGVQTFSPSSGGGLKLVGGGGLAG